jgi:CRP-like cAMP-binding protein
MSSIHPMIRKLDSIARLNEAERDAIASLPLQLTTIRARQDVVREGDRPSRSCVLLEGVAAVYKNTPTGGRQIMAFYLPGDIPDLQSLHLGLLDISMGTISPCKVGFVPHDVLRAFCEQQPRLAGLLWRETLIDAAIFREWLVNIGRRTGSTRLAHLLCEWITRCRSLDLCDGDSVPFPMTQSELADATGFTAIHINRLLKELRTSGAVQIKGATLTVLDWETLKEIGQFDPAYLHLGPRNGSGSSSDGEARPLIHVSDVSSA